MVAESNALRRRDLIANSPKPTAFARPSMPGKGEFMSTTTAENRLTERRQTQINLVSRQEVKCTLV